MYAKSAFAFTLCLAAGCIGPSPSANHEAESGWPVLKTYAGDHLSRVKMPLGGIGTGTVSLSGRGALVDWEIRNSPAKGYTPGDHHAASGFWLRTKDAEGNVVARLMEGPLDVSLYEGGEGSRAPNHGFPRFANCTFKAAYPFAQVALADASVPVQATLEAMNPLVPGDADASGIPAVLLRWKVTNVSARPLDVSILGALFNAAGGAVKRETIGGAGLKGVRIGSEDLAPADSTRGEVVLVACEKQGTVSTATHVANNGWKVKMDRFWKRFVATGKAQDLVDPIDPAALQLAATSVETKLAPGETKALSFVLAWRFPHRPGWTRQGYRDVPTRGAFDPAREVGNYYATRFASAEAAARALVADLPALEEKTRTFVESVLAANAPAVVKEAALFNLSTLRTETCFRTADGHFFGWEGTMDETGSCFGNCTHVWGYEHTLVDLWPDLARDMLETEYGPALDARGHMSFRVGLPLAKHARATIACADGQMQCAIKAYEYWRKSGDAAWLAKWYPRIKRSIEFCWIPGGWDADKDGVMEGCQHNTMDVEYYGPNPQMEFLYLAALEAVGAMAEARKDAAFAQTCADLVRRGKAWTEANLFNGAYYEHKVVPPKTPVASGISYGSAKNLADPDWQLAAGCLVDQLLGDYAARHVGLPPVADEAHANAALSTILAKNASANVGAVYNCGREYAFPEEPALKMAWYPPGRMPDKPFPYYGENMTGFEYVVAANLAQRGRLAEAEKIVRDIRSRYDGRKRSPFDEAECGHHYARALDAWSVLKAFEKHAGK